MHRRMLIAAAAFLPMVRAAHAAEPEIFTGLVDGVAAGGYDVVSYFEAEGAKPGSSDFTVRWKGAVWRFATKSHLEAFEADPMKYAPQFGGYCAYAVSKGATAKGDPKVWKIVDGKLYLNLSPEVQKLWSADIKNSIAAAEANWPAVLGK